MFCCDRKKLSSYCQDDSAVPRSTHKCGHYLAFRRAARNYHAFLLKTAYWEKPPKTNAEHMQNECKRIQLLLEEFVDGSWAPRRHLETFVVTHSRIAPTSRKTMKELLAKAYPRKNFFVQMFTKDVSLEDCVLDLIDTYRDIHQYSLAYTEVLL